MDSGRENTYFFALEDVTRNDFGSLNFDKLAITKNGGLESERLLQFFDNGTGLVFLDETDEGVEQQKSADDTKIDPILKTSSENSGSLQNISKWC